MYISSLMDVVQSDCYLQKAVHEALRIQVFIFIAEETLFDEISECLSLELFEKDQETTMGLFHFERLCDMYVISNLNPVLDFLFNYFFLFLAIDFFILFQGQNSVLLLENGVGGGIEPIERMLFEGSAIDTFAACGLAYGPGTVLLSFFFEWEAFP